MGSYHKTGGKIGKPGYRTPSMFRNKVLKVVSGIPKGKTLSYKKVAEFSGSPKAYRAVGNILNKNYDSKIPCHRVIKSDGEIGGYNRGEEKKRKILEKERIKL
jgi:O-6-methylguanine DNA methyltransferase